MTNKFRQSLGSCRSQLVKTNFVKNRINQERTIMKHYVNNHLCVHAPDEETMDQFWKSSAFSDFPVRVVKFNTDIGLLSYHFLFRTDSEPPTDEFLKLADRFKDVENVFFGACWEIKDGDDQVLDSGMMASCDTNLKL